MGRICKLATDSFCPDHKTPGQKKQNFEIKPVDLT